MAKRFVAATVQAQAPPKISFSNMELEPLSKHPVLVDDWNTFLLVNEYGSPFTASLPDGRIVQLPPAVKYNMIKFKSPFESETSRNSKDGSSKCYPLTMDILVPVETSDYICLLFLLSLNHNRVEGLESLPYHDLVKLMHLANVYVPGFLPELLEAVWRNTATTDVNALFRNPQMSLIENSNPMKLAELVGFIYLGLAFSMKNDLINLVSGYISRETVLSTLSLLAERILYYYPATTYEVNNEVVGDLDVLADFVMDGKKKKFDHKKIFDFWRRENLKKLEEVQQDHLHFDVEGVSADGEKMVRVAKVWAKMGYPIDQEELKSCGKHIAALYREIRGHDAPRTKIVINEGDEPTTVNKYTRADYEIIKLGIKKYFLMKGGDAGW